MPYTTNKTLLHQMHARERETMIEKRVEKTDLEVLR
jgi:hypothetical protein